MHLLIPLSLNLSSPMSSWSRHSGCAAPDLSSFNPTLPLVTAAKMQIPSSQATRLAILRTNSKILELRLATNPPLDLHKRPAMLLLS